MKRSWIITIFLCMLLLAGGGIAVILPRIVPFSESSDVYKKYSKMDGIEASFIKDFKINDTLTLDVTVLKANDTNAWEVISKDFAFVALTPDQAQAIRSGKNLIVTKSTPKITTPSPDSFDKDLLAISHLNHTVTVFHVTRKCETFPIIFYNYRDIIKL